MKPILLLTSAASLLVVASCGRAAVSELGLSGGTGDGGGGSGGDGSVRPGLDGAIRLDGSLGGDAGRPGDAGARRDGGVPDAGECAAAFDCFELYRRPPECPDGRGSWACSAGTCTPACGEVMCGNDCDCPPFASCLGGLCQPANRENLCCSRPDCPPGQSCELPGGGESICEEPPPRPDGGTAGPVGQPCDQTPGSCGQRGFCIGEDQGFPGGYCSAPCGPNRPCPGDGLCREVGMGNTICLDGCTAGADCREGYVCGRAGVGMGQVCLPIPEGSMNPNGAPVGGDCAGDEDCGPELVCIELPGNAPGGYCTKVFCDPMTNPCPQNAECYAFPGLYSICLAECPVAGEQSTCRPGYYCLGPAGQAGVCVGL